MDDATIIERLGGPTKLAGILGYGKGGAQRVFNWKARGDGRGRIPSDVKLQRQDLFGPESIRALEAQAAAEAVGGQGASEQDRTAIHTHASA